MSAAPPSISKDATILDWPPREGDQPVVLRTGTNRWTCFPDDPTTPGNDPMCVDKIWLQWVEAWMAKKDFKPTLPGIGYMLQGGSTASNADPFATTPAPGDKWMKEQPHVMVIVPGKLDPTARALDHVGRNALRTPDGSDQIAPGRRSRELGNHLGHEALHLLDLVEDWIEQDQLRPGLCDLAQTSHASVRWPVDRERLQVAQLKERIEAL